MLLAIALFGLLVPNGLFLYWLFAEFHSVAEVLANHLALGFMLDALLATGLLCFLFAVRPAGPVSWRWFLLLALLGGLGFAIPFFLWLNFRRSGPGQQGFRSWWRTI